MLFYGYKIARWLALKVSVRTGYRTANFLADIYYIFAKNDKRNLITNLSVALKTGDKKIIKRRIRNIFRNFAKYLFDFLRFSIIDKDYIASHVKVTGRENIDKALSEGNGALLVSAHIGNWELGAAVIALLGYPFYAIALDHKDKRINDFFLGQRAACNVNIIPMGRQMKTCFRVLKQNKILAIVGDRIFSNNGFIANFFGRPTAFPKGPAFFSMRAGTPILPCFLVRLKEDKFELIFEAPLTPHQGADMESGVERLTQQYVKVLEEYVNRYSDQWYEFRKLWE